MKSQDCQRRDTHQPTVRGQLAAALVCVLTSAPALAGSSEFGAHLDAQPAFALSAPQSTYFGTGFSLTGTALLQPMPMLDVEAQLGWLMLTANPASTLGRGGNLLSIGLGARLKRPMQRNQVVPYLELAGALAMTGGTRFQLAPAAGVLFRWKDDLPVWLGLNVRLLQVFKMGEVPDLASFDASILSVGLAVEFHTGGVPRDSDGDGVMDDQDACPNEAGKGTDGCAARPAVPPLVAAAVDTDGDGVPDSIDRCPTEPEDKDGFQDEDGCPDVDDDKDGVPDAIDECRTEPGPAASNGCPDSDGDGVPDKKDPCPKVAGPKENGGCPTYKEVVVTDTKIEIKQKVFFAFGGATILPKSEGLLNEVVQALQDRSAICVRVEGHTDSKGNADANLKLSKDRASAVKDYLEAHGIKGDRVRSRGYGSMLPRDDNKTAEGRDNNRRVEFVIVPCKEEESP